METYKVVGVRGSHIFWTVEVQMSVRLSALRAGRPLTQEDSCGHVRGEVYPRSIVRLEVLLVGQLENPLTSEIESET
jgi:hypothetical protein